MGNTLTNLTHTLLAEKALEGYTAALTPLNAFSRNFSAEAVQRGDKVKVFYTGAADAAEDFAGSYTMQDADAEGLDITINKHHFVSWGLTDKSLSTQPQLSLERFAFQKGFQLGKKVLQTVWADITVANFGAAVFNDAASNFDADDVQDIEKTCDEADWPTMERSLILKPAYYGAVVKDNAVQGTLGVRGNGVLEKSAVPELHNFAMYKSNLVPTNSEDLVGFAVHPDAILIAMRALQVPEAASRSGLLHEVLTNEAGMVMGFRDWYDNDTGTHKRVLEAVYGSRVGNTAGIKRIES